MLSSWTLRQWGVALAASIGVALVIGLPNDIIPNPVFGRSIGVTWWSYPVLAVTAVLGGLLAATYVRSDIDRPARAGGVGGLLAYFAVGCPVCNKLVLLAVGTTGARDWFEPVQPYLAGISIVLLAAALRARLRTSVACTVPG